MPDGAIAYPAYGKDTWLPNGAVAYPAYGKVTWLPDGAIAYPAYGERYVVAGWRYRLSGLRESYVVAGWRYRLSGLRGKIRGCRMALSLIRPTGKLRGCRKCYVGPIRRSRHRAISATSGAWRSAIQMPVHAPLPLLFSGATLQAESRQPAFQIPVARTMAHSTAHCGRWSA